MRVWRVRAWRARAWLTVADVALFFDVSQILGGEFEESLGIGAKVLKDCLRLVGL